MVTRTGRSGPGVAPRSAVQTDADELRQANCRTGAGPYVLVTFRTDRGQREWLDAADDYGGTRLLGRTWIVVGERPVLAELRGRLGGTVVESSHHSGHSAGGESEEGHHSGHRAS